MASTGSVRRHLQENPSNFDPRKFLKEATNAMKDICKARYEAFGSAGNADKIGKIYSLDEMSQKYVAGDLDQKIS
jgi:fructose-bisphosphate aldolase class II